LLIAGEKAHVDRARALLQAAGVPHHYLGYVTPGLRPFNPGQMVFPPQNIPSQELMSDLVKPLESEITSQKKHKEGFPTDQRESSDENQQSESTDRDCLGTDEQLSAICHALEADELVLCGDGYTNKQMIAWIESLGGSVPSIKILPEGADFIMGSSSVNHPGTIYSSHPEMRITRADQQRKKRTFDVLVSLALLILWPLFGWWFYPRSLRATPSLWRVLVGQLSLISFPQTEYLPKMKAGLISIDSGGGGGSAGGRGSGGSHIWAQVDYRLRSDYCRHYSIGLDLGRLISEFRMGIR
jgi:hypothetical protein